MSLDIPSEPVQAKPFQPSGGFCLGFLIGVFLLGYFCVLIGCFPADFPADFFNISVEKRTSIRGYAKDPRKKNKARSP